MTFQIKPMADGIQTAQMSRTTIRKGQFGDGFLKCVAVGSYLAMSAVSASLTKMSND